MSWLKRILAVSIYGIRIASGLGRFNIGMIRLTIWPHTILFIAYYWTPLPFGGTENASIIPFNPANSGNVLKPTELPLRMQSFHSVCVCVRVGVSWEPAPKIKGTYLRASATDRYGWIMKCSKLRRELHKLAVAHNLIAGIPLALLDFWVPFIEFFGQDLAYTPEVQTVSWQNIIPLSCPIC